jgi:hypothetical protein
LQVDDDDVRIDGVNALEKPIGVTQQRNVAKARIP